MPVPDSHSSSRNSAMTMTTRSAIASPTDLSSTARNGRVNIWSSALNTASSIGLALHAPNTLQRSSPARADASKKRPCATVDVA